MASTKDSHATPVAPRPFSEIANCVKSGSCIYDDILELFNVGTSIPDEAENLEVTEILCDVLDLKISVPTDFVDKLKSNVCDWFAICIPPLFATKKWKRELALKLIGTIRKLVGDIEVTLQDNWESLRNILLRHVDSLMELVCARDEHWFDVWIVAIDILGNKLALNSNRPLLNKLFKVLSPFKEDFQLYPSLQAAVREMPFKLLTVTCWRKVVDYWLRPPADVPLNHVMTIIRFFKRQDAEATVVRAKCIVMWRVLCLLPPGHKGFQPSLDQFFAMLLNQSASKTSSKASKVSPVPSQSNLELVPDILSEMLALTLGAHLHPEFDFVFSDELFSPTHELIGASSMYLQKVFQCFEKLLLIDTTQNAIKPNAAALKAAFNCFLSKLNSNPSSELINSVLKLPQSIFVQSWNNTAVINNCVEIVIQGIVCGPHCFGDNIMTSSKYYSGSIDLMTGSPALMLTRILLAKSIQNILDIDLLVSILKALILTGTKSVHYIEKIMCLLKLLSNGEHLIYPIVLKAWQIVVVSINSHFCCEADFTRETPVIEWIYNVILFPLHCFNAQNCDEITSLMGSKHQSELHVKLMANDVTSKNAIAICEALSLKLDSLLSGTKATHIPAITAATRVLITSTPLAKIPQGKRHLSSTFALAANLITAVKNLNCLTEDFVLEFVKILEALLVCLEGDFTSLVDLTSLGVKLLRLPLQSKCATDSTLKFARLLIKTAENKYGSTALPSIATLNAAVQYCELVSKAVETQSSVLTPKRFPTQSDATSPASVRRITPKRVDSKSSTAAADGEASKIERKSAKKLYTGSPSPVFSARADSPQAATGNSGEAKKTTVKTLAAAHPPSPNTSTGLAQLTNGSSPQLAPPRKRAVASRGPLTKHQREKMRERQDNIPALYVDLTQESQAVADSQSELTQDSNSLVIPQRFKVVQADSPICVDSRPFASVVQVPEVVEVDIDKGPPKDTAKPKSVLLRKSKHVMLPIHLKKVHASREIDEQDVTTKPAGSPAGSPDRPFQAFSPANKKKQELAYNESVTPLNPKCQTDAPGALENGDDIAIIPAEVNSPVRTLSQRKVPKRNTLDFLWENNSKRKSLKRGVTDILDGSEPDQSLCKKQNLTNTGTAASKEGNKHFELSSIIDESSNNSTDSAMSVSRKGKCMELTRLKSNLVLNESPLPTKRARRSSMITASDKKSNDDVNKTKTKKSSKTSKSQSQVESDCESVASEVSTASDISLTNTKRRRSRVITIDPKEVVLQQMNSSSVEIQPQLKPGNKLKSKSSGCKTSSVDLGVPIEKEQNEKTVSPKIPILNVVNLTPTAMKFMLMSQKQKASTNQGNTKNLIPAKITKATSEEDSQKLFPEVNVQPTSVIAASPHISTLSDKSNTENTIIEHTTLSVVDRQAPEIEEVMESHLPSLVDAEHKNSLTEDLPSIKAVPVNEAESSKEAVPLIEALPLQEEIQPGEVVEEENVSIPLGLVCLDSDVVSSGIATETCEDLHATNNSTNRPENNFCRQASDKENKIVEESQDSIIPCSQSEVDTFKVLSAKRRHIRPKILSRSFAKSESKMVVLSPVSVIPETQILDTEIETENNSNLDCSQTMQPLVEPVTSNATCRSEQHGGNDALVLAENQTVLSMEEMEIETPGDAVVQTLLPAVTQASESQDLPIVEDLVVKAKDVPEEDNKVTCILSEKASSKDDEMVVGEEIMSPPRPGSKVMENLSPSMLRLLNSTHAAKVCASEPTCRSRKMLQMVLPFAPEPGAKLKPQTEKQEPVIYVDQTFPAQECLVGDDGTPVLRDWKKCVPSPSSVPARSSLKGSLQRNETSNNRKLHFPFEPTTKVLYYYEKKNSKCNENLSLVKIKKQLRKKRKADQKAFAALEKEGNQPNPSSLVIEEVYTEALPTNLDLAPAVLSSDDPSSTKSDSTIVDETTSSVDDTLQLDAQLISLPVTEMATEDSVASSPDTIIYCTNNVISVEELPSTLPVTHDITEKAFSTAGAFEVVTSDSEKIIDLTNDTPLFSTSQEMESPIKSMVVLTDPILTDKEVNSANIPASNPATFPNAPAKKVALFEDSYHDYATPTPLSLPDPEMLNDTDPLYADLVDCQQPIMFMVPSLTTPQWQEDLGKELAERNILTVGDFCRRTERQIDLLPIKGNKVKTSLRALQKYKPRLQIADACAKDLLKGLECNKHAKEVFDKLYPCATVAIAFAQTCSEMEDAIHDNFVKESSGDKLLDMLEKSGKLADDGFLEKLVKKIEPRNYVPMHCTSGAVDDLSLEVANSINLLPSEERMRRINTLLSHLKFKD